MANFSESDELQLLAQPGYFYIRKTDTDPWQKIVFQNGSTYQVNTETTSIAFDDVGDVRDEVSTETVTINTSSGQVLNLDYIELLSGGLYTKTTVDGSTVTGETQTISASNWTYDQFLLIENQNGDLSEITINSVTQDPTGSATTLTEGTDYYKTQVPEAGWGIVVVSNGTTDDTLDLEIDYDYTPASKTKLTRGGKNVIDKIQLAFQTLDANDEYVTYYFYKVYTDGNLGHGFSPENSAEPVTMDLTFTARNDTNRTSGDQLYSIERGGTTPLA